MTARSHTRHRRAEKRRDAARRRAVATRYGRPLRRDRDAETYREEQNR
ncbi:hypothetical protein [Promicromonospora sp. NPDC050880]